jgi:hypothetical protein
MAYETKSEALETVVATAHQELVDIGTEMQDDFDEKGERWQESDKGQDLLTAAEHFTSLDYPEPPDSLKSNTIEWPRTIYKNPTRAQRVEICITALRSVIEALGHDEENEETKDFVEALEQLASDAESVEPIGR